MDTALENNLSQTFPPKPLKRLCEAFSLGQSIHVRTNYPTASQSLLWLIVQDRKALGNAIFIGNEDEAITSSRNQKITFIDPFLDPMFHVLRTQPDVVIANGDNVMQAKTGCNFHTGIEYTKEYLEVQHENMLYVLRKRNTQLLTAGSQSIRYMQNKLSKNLREQVCINYDIEVTLGIKEKSYGSTVYKINFSSLKP